jgi:hypothetical protein
MVNPVKKTSPNRENTMDLINAGPSSARHSQSRKLVFQKGNGQFAMCGGRLQPNQNPVGVKRKKKTSASTSCKKHSPQSRKIRGVKQL